MFMLIFVFFVFLALLALFMALTTVVFRRPAATPAPAPAPTSITATFRFPHDFSKTGEKRSEADYSNKYKRELEVNNKQRKSAFFLQKANGTTSSS